MKIKDNMKACDFKTDRKAAVYTRKPKIFIRIFCDNLYKKKAEQLCSASIFEAPLNAVIFTAAAHPNEGETGRRKDARSSEKPF